MEKFEEEKTTYEQQIGGHQHTISALLEHMQTTMVRETKLPSQSEAKNNQADLAFKQG